VLDLGLGKTPVVKKAMKLFTIKFVIQIIAKVSSITFGKSRNVPIISVVFTGVNKSYLLRNTNLGYINPLNAELNSICHLLALGAHHILHVGRIRVNAVAVDKV
jgi:hypothetical protein